jgi:O-antigen/teichoic acid export membrane protein
MILYIKELLKLLKRDSRTAKAGKQVIYSFFLQSISISISFLYVPLLLNYLTQEKYGIWLTLTSILGWFSFFDIGLGNGLRNKLGEAFAKNDLVLGKKYVSTTYALLILIFSIVLVIFQISNNFLNWNSLLNTHTIDAHELYLLTSIVFVFFIIRFVAQLITVIYLADQRSAIDKFINSFSSIISFIFVLIITYISAKGNLTLLGSIVSVVPVLILVVISIYSFNGKYKSIRPSYRAIDFKLSKNIMNLGFMFFFLQITSIIIFATSSFFIAQFYGTKEVVVYNIAYKYFQLPFMVFAIILSPVWSAVTDAYTKSDYVWLNKTIKRLNYLSALFSVAVIIMVIFSHFAFKLWIGNKVIVPQNLSIAMGIYFIMQLWLAPYSNFINGMGKIKLTMTFTFLGIVVYLALIFGFRHLFTNSTGVIMAIICTSIIGAVIQPLQIHKILKGTAKGIWNK